MSKLFCDCKTDEEKSNFFLSGQGVETGIIAPAISNEVAMAFHRCFEFKKQLATSQKREVMLRTALEDFLKQYPHMTKGYLLDALAATDDLSDYILCEKEPVTPLSGRAQPLYRAKE